MNGTTALNSTGHRSSFAVYLVGQHTTQVVRMNRSLLITMPSARVRISHPQALYAAVTGWHEAMELAARTFATATTALNSPPNGGAQATATITFDGPVHGPQVDARAAAVSHSGAGEIRIQVGPLAITTGDLAAFKDQLAMWTRAYVLAADLWPELPALERPRTTLRSEPRIATALRPDAVAVAA